MKLSDLTIDELECMGYDEIAELILEETGKKQKLLDLFKKVCKVLKLNFDDNSDKVVDFFELLSINKKFVMLDNGYWDLQVNHKTDIKVEDHEEEHIDEDHEDFDHEEVENHEEDIFYEGNDADDTVEDDLADLVVVDDEDEEASM